MRFASIASLSLGILGGCGAEPLDLLARPDPWAHPCDVVAQDCPDGQKCGFDHRDFAVPVWFSSSGEAAPVGPAQCVSQRGQVGLDQACTVDLASGLDDCDAGLTCFTTDAARSVGSCVALCAPGAGTCEGVGLPGLACVTTYIDAPGVCLLDCRLGESECPVGQSCSYWYDYPDPRNSTCMPAGEVEAGGECGDARCAEGLACYDAECRAPCHAETEAEDCTSGHCIAFPDGDGVGFCWNREGE